MDPGKAKAEKEERERLERLEREAAEAAIRARILAEENRKRGFHLRKSGEIIKKYDGTLENSVGAEGVGEEWVVFLACRPTPDLRKLFLVNSYLAQWIRELENGGTRLEVVLENTANILEV